MVFKRNIQPFTDDDPCQLAYKHLRQLDCGDQRASFAELSSFRAITEKQPISGGEREGMFIQSRGQMRLVEDADDVYEVVNIDEFESEATDCPDGTRFSRVTNNTCEVARSEHSKRTFSHDRSYEVAVKRARQIDQNSRVHSSAEIASFISTSEEQLTSGGEREGMFIQSRGQMRLVEDADDVYEVINIDEFESEATDCPDGTRFSRVTNNTCEVVRSEHSKRTFSHDRSYEVAVKRARQIDQNSRVHSSAEIASFISTSEEQPTSVAPAEDLEKREAASVSDDPVWLSFFPGYFDECPTTGFNRPEEIHSTVSDHPHRKLVAIGPNHQADLPVWRSQGRKNFLEESDGCASSSSSSGPLLIDEDDSDRWFGTCIMPMSDSDSLALENRVGNRKLECSCPDEGSIGCTRQHAMEAREKLKTALGPERFEQLGFCDMGEVVAHKWTKEEEQLFREVILSNPSSLGRNFWYELRRVFRARTSKELVSYYFNVFVLRKRAEQNRSDPWHADSDDDEWQDGDDCELATEEHGEDSAVESPAERDDAAFIDDGCAEVDIHEEGVDGTDSDDCRVSSKGNEKFYGISQAWIDDESEFSPNLPPTDKNSPDSIQYDSCTTSEDHHNAIEPRGGPADFTKAQDSLVEHGKYRNEGLSGTSDHEYITGSWYPEAWEIDYGLGTAKKIDLWPTSNVIEELFGKEDWENEAKDRHGIN